MNVKLYQYILREKKKHFFEMTVSKPLVFDKSLNIDDISAELNRILEKMILKNLDQWIWTHNRWQK